MMKLRKAILIPVAMIIFIVTSLLPVSLLAQSIWIDRSHDKIVSLEILKPNFDERLGDYTFLTAALFLSLRLSGTQTDFVIEIPFAHGGTEFYTYFGGSEMRSENKIGNPYLGIEIHGQDSPFFAELGLRAPLTSEDNDLASFVGIWSDPDRMEAFAPDLLSITGKANFRHKSPSDMMFRLRGGPVWWINTDQAGGDATELLLDYSAQAGYESTQVTSIVGLTGKMLLTEDNLDLGERTFHQLGFATSFALGNVRPGIHIRLPLDDNFTYILDYVFGLNLAINLE